MGTYIFGWDAQTRGLIKPGLGQERLIDIFHITFRDCRVRIFFFDSLFRNSCIKFAYQIHPS